MRVGKDPDFLKMEGSSDAGQKQPPRRMSRRRVRAMAGDADAMLECEKCGKKFVTRGGLSVHVCRRRKSLKNQVPGDRNHQRTGGKAVTVVNDSGGGGDDCDLDYQGPSAKQKGRLEKSEKRREKARCDVCGETFVNCQVLRVHQRRHTGERPYVCTLCECRFTQHSALVGHMNTHANEQHECKECGKTFTQLRSLKRHAKFHTGEKDMKKGTLLRFRERLIKLPVDVPEKSETSEPLISRTVQFQEMYQCEFCDKCFKTGSQYVVHRRIHTDERPFECKTCGRSFRQRITLLDHETTHRNDKPHECERCGSRFKQARILRKHKNSRICEKRTKIKELSHESFQRDVESESDVKLHSETETEGLTRSEKDDDANVSCEEGASATLSESPKTNSEDNPEMHVNGDNDCSETYICEQCGKIFHKKKNLYQHIKTHTNEKPYICSECNKGFRLNSTLREHMETHTVGRPHSCQNCQKQFKTQRCLQNHIGRNICTQIRPYTCEVCNKSFMYARYLERHRCLQSTPKEFKCTHCERVFTRNHLLVEHIRTHTGERPLQCSDCKKTFAKRDLLRRHRLVHSADKKFECDLCGKKFSLRASLRTHMAVHTSERNFICGICNKAFKQASSLRTHSKTHNPKQSESKPAAFLCAHCGKMFRHFRRMLKHYCVAHGGKRFKCHACQKMFEKKQQLEVHMRIHTGDRPYHCLECGKRFTQSGSLKNHLVTHSGEKLHQCDICDVRFSRMTSLRRHKLIIHCGVEPFICNVCGLTFKYQKALKKHSCLAETNAGEAALVGGPAMEKVPEVASVAEVDASQSDLEQEELDKILGNIKRAMTGAGIEIKDNIQYQIVVGENSEDLIVSVGGEPQQ